MNDPRRTVLTTLVENHSNIIPVMFGQTPMNRYRDLLMDDTSVQLYTHLAECYKVETKYAYRDYL